MKKNKEKYRSQDHEGDSVFSEPGLHPDFKIEIDYQDAKDRLRILASNFDFHLELLAELILKRGKYKPEGVLETKILVTVNMINSIIVQLPDARKRVALIEKELRRRKRLP